MKNNFFKNIKLNEDELKENKVVLKSNPRTLRIILTNLCNINCIMCDIQGQNKFTIPYEKIIKIKKLFPYLERIDWQGGEVFLVDYFKEFFKEISEYKNIHQTIQTNGLFLDEEWADLLLKNNVSLSISIDGVTKEVYENIRKGAKFSNLLNNLLIFNKIKNKYNSNFKKILCVCIMRSNYLQFKDFVNFALEYEFNGISFGFIHGNHVPKEENIFNPKNLEIITYLKDAFLWVKTICKENNIELNCNFEKMMFNDKNIDNNYSNSNEQVICKLPWINLTIDAIRNGNIYPECLCSKSVGNIISDELDYVWNNDLMQEYRKLILNGKYLEICNKDCFNF